MGGIFPGNYRVGRVRLLRRLGVIASSVAMLAAMGVGISAGPASADTVITMCVFVSSGQSTVVCAYNTPLDRPITMAFEEASVFDATAGRGTGDYGLLDDNNACMQGWANRPYNGGWTVALETCQNLSGQLWRAQPGPVVQGLQSYYWISKWNPAYCLAWDKNAGTLFANTCRNVWYQQFVSALA